MDHTDAVVWAVTAVARLLRCNSCLVKALATDVMLRRRSIPSELRWGVLPGPPRSRSLEAHAWIESQGRVVMGSIDGLSGYRVLSGGRLS